MRGTLAIAGPEWMRADRNHWHPRHGACVQEDRGTEEDFDERDE